MPKDTSANNVQNAMRSERWYRPRRSAACSNRADARRQAEASADCNRDSLDGAEAKRAISWSPKLDPGRLRGTVETGLEIENEPLGARKPLLDELPTLLPVGRMGNRQDDRSRRLKRVLQHQLDAVFVHRFRGISQRIGDLRLQPERFQLPDDVDNLRVANVGHVLLERKAEHGHHLTASSVSEDGLGTLA